MKPAISRLLSCAALLLAVAPAVPAAAGPDPTRGNVPAWTGVWRNMNNTVHIKAAPCGPNMCAIVVWADEQTKAAVAAKGRNILGMQLLRDFNRTAPTQWKGTVYVPDRDLNVSGTITMVDPNLLKSVGCAMWGMVCQTRHWARIS